MNVAEACRLCAYNEWANALFLRALGELSEETYARDLGSSFRSIRDTASHLVTVEWVWLRRWLGDSPTAAPEWAAAPSVALLRVKLDEVESERSTFLATLHDADLERFIAYKNLKGQRFEYRLGDHLRHLVNHSTYHRGQLATLLRQVGAASPSTDYLLYLDG